MFKPKVNGYYFVEKDFILASNKGHNCTNKEISVLEETLGIENPEILCSRTKEIFKDDGYDKSKDDI